MAGETVQVRLYWNKAVLIQEGAKIKFNLSGLPIQLNKEELT
jgi:hypothetical protein